MSTGNPVLKRVSRERPVEGAAAVTQDGVLRKTILCLVVAFTAAAGGWMVPALAMPAVLLGAVLGLVIVFKRRPSPGLVLAYSAVEGFALGGMSAVFEARWEGIALQALLATTSVAGISVWLYRSGRVRVTAKSVKFLLFAMLGLIVYSLLNLVLMWTGLVDGTFGLDSQPIPGTSIPMGVVVGALAICMAAYCLIVDLAVIDEAAREGWPAQQEWYLAAGLIMTLVWLYVEMLRLIAILRGDD